MSSVIESITLTSNIHSMGCVSLHTLALTEPIDLATAVEDIAATLIFSIIRTSVFDVLNLLIT